MGADGEAIMINMINDQDDYTQAEPKTQVELDTQAEGYDIDVEQLFPPNGIPTQEGMTAATLAATLVGCFPEVKRISQRTASYTLEEYKVLCEAWLEISSDPICGAEQKGFNYWRKVGKFFHERRKICEKPFQSDRNDLSLSKRWGTIHAECSKFQGSFEKIQKRPISGLAPVDLAKPYSFLLVDFGLCMTPLVIAECRSSSLWSTSRRRATTRPSHGAIVGPSSRTPKNGKIALLFG
jgi:hypothetical protein